MESKIFIDINYASKMPQIVIKQTDSDDPRDKLVSMLTGEAMPGVRDGFCRIERYPEGGGTVVVITPVSPTDMIKYLRSIVELAETNACIDTSGVKDQYRAFIEEEYRRVVPIPAGFTMDVTDKWLQQHLPHNLYKQWVDSVLYPTEHQKLTTE